MESKWVLCPLCKNKTRVKLLPDTVLKNYLLFCPKCKKEFIVNAENQQVEVIKQTEQNTDEKPDA